MSASSPTIADWQPIETAPPFRIVLLFRPLPETRNWHIAAGHITTSGAFKMDGQTIYQHQQQPTHWAPLPEPPGST